jgi:hypothetical protein
MLTLPQIEEEWKQIKGYPHYEVSNHGRVRSLPHVTTCLSRWGTLRQIPHEGKLLKIHLPKNGYGYAEVKLSLDGESKTHRVHVLVANAFLGKRPKGKPNVLHKDDNPRNPHVLNLEWGSQQDNLTDMRIKGRSSRGSAHVASSLCEAEVRTIIRLLKRRIPMLQIADRFAVSDSAIRCIRDGVTWSHVTGLDWRGGRSC